MRPRVWEPPVDLSLAEQAIVRRIRRAKLFVFLRQWRHELFPPSFQEELGTPFKDSRRGQPPVPPAQLALATILQAYTGVSDDEVIEATTMDRRWQLVLDCLDAAQPPFSKGTLVAFRARLIAKDLDRRLIERTVELAAARGGFGARPLRVALDSSPLWGAGRVEDTYNLLGHALRKALGVLARQQGRGLADLGHAAGAELVVGSSLKAALDCNWDDPAVRRLALGRVLTALDAVEAWLTAPQAGEPLAEEAVASLAVAQAVRAQDVEVGDDGHPVLRQGVAPDRRISVEDGEMRHGRKSKSQRIDGYKRHVLHDLDLGVVRAVALTPANVPDAAATEPIGEDLASQHVELGELHIDRAYLASTWVRERDPRLQIYCKAWPVHQGQRFAKTAFTLDWERHTLRCPDQVVVPFKPGGVVHFPAERCAVCVQRERCTTSPNGRSVAIHPDEALLGELRQRQLTPAGRARLRERVAVEHTLAHVGRWQGRRARYRSRRKNLFDLRRCAVVQNLHVIARYPAAKAA